MKRFRVSPYTTFALLLIIVLAALLWHSRPNSLQIRQHRLNALLVNAAIDGDAVAVQDLLRNGADPNFCQQPSSHWEMLRNIFPAVPHIYCPGPPPLYETVLGLAVLNYKPEVVRVLLAGGADVQQEDSYGQTALDLVYLEKGDKIFVMLTESARKRKWQK